LNAAKATLQSAGATDDDWELFKAFIHTTDVSKDFSNSSAHSPAETVKNIAPAKIRMTYSPNYESLLTQEQQILP
jgi:hypothetical protein